MQKKSQNNTTPAIFGPNIITVGLDLQYTLTKNQFPDKPEGLRQIRDHEQKAWRMRHIRLLCLWEKTSWHRQRRQMHQRQHWRQWGQHARWLRPGRSGIIPSPLALLLQDLMCPHPPEEGRAHSTYGSIRGGRMRNICVRARTGIVSGSEVPLG